MSVALAHLVGAAVRSIFNEPDQSSAHRRLQEVAEKLGTRFPRVRNLLLEAAEDVLAYYSGPLCQDRHEVNLSLCRRVSGRASVRAGGGDISDHQSQVDRLRGPVPQGLVRALRVVEPEVGCQALDSLRYCRVVL